MHRGKHSSQRSHSSRVVVLDKSTRSAPQSFLMVLFTEVLLDYALRLDVPLFLCPNFFACSLVSLGSATRGSGVVAEP